MWGKKAKGGQEQEEEQTLPEAQSHQCSGASSTENTLNCLPPPAPQIEMHCAENQNVPRNVPKSTKMY